MLRYRAALCLLLAPLAAVSGTEIDGLESSAIDISASLDISAGPRRSAYGAAFVSLDARGIPNGITIQAREIGGFGPSCSVTLPLPPGSVQVSHPAVTDNGWLFVSSYPDPDAPGRRALFARRRVQGMLGIGRDHCWGWGDSWTKLGSPQTSIISAPDAAIVGSLTFVFVTDRAHQVQYQMYNDAVRSPNWSGWFPLAVTSSPGYEAWSKPAVAVYNADPTGAGRGQLHLFWLDQTRQLVHHAGADVERNGFLAWTNPRSSRRFEDEAGATTANTACSASPSVQAPNPLFIVCGNRRGGYSIAHYRYPAMAWSDDLAVERVGGRYWISRSMYGGVSAPSLRNPPSMFVTFGNRYCPDRAARQRALGPTCLDPNPRWLIERAWNSVSITLPPGIPQPFLTGWRPESGHTAGGPLN